MKTKLYAVIILFAFVTLFPLPNSFAQKETTPDYIVRVIYFLAKDRSPQQNIDAQLDTMIKRVQQFYADEMERHGFGRKTFRLETDTHGNAVVHHVKAKFNRSHYIGDKSLDTVTNTVMPEINERFDTSKNIDLVVVDFGQAVGGRGGLSHGGFALTTINDCYNLGDFFPSLPAHELGHAFGLPHDFRNGAHIMSYGPRDIVRLSECAAEWLDAHPYFNIGGSSGRTPTTIQMLPPLAYPPNAIRFRFEITDDDGLHQAQLIGRFDKSSVRDEGPSLIACKRLNGKRNTVEFVTTELAAAPDGFAYLQVMDVHGNITRQNFPIRKNDIHIAPNNRIDINGDGVINADDRTPATLRKVSGDNQHGLPNSWLPEPFVVEVLDANGNPVVGIEVVFRVTSYPIGTVDPEVIATGTGAFSVTNPRTDSNGRAQSFLMLGYSSAHFRPQVNVSSAGVSGRVTFDFISLEHVLINPSEIPPMFWIDTEKQTLYGPAGTKWGFDNAATSVSLNTLSRQLYWTAIPLDGDRHCAVIRRANLKDSINEYISEQEDLATLMSVPLATAIDTTADKLYWIDSQGSIQRANLDGTNIQTLITGIDSPKHIAVDMIGGKLYWAETQGRIRRANLNGSNTQTFVTKLGMIGSITVAGRHLYWTEKINEELGKISRATLDRSNVEEIVTSSSVPIGVAVDLTNSKLYWTETRGHIQRANLDGSNIEDIVTGLIAPGQLILDIDGMDNVSPRVLHHPGNVYSVSFSSDGKMLASGGEAIYLWDTNMGTRLRTFGGYTELVSSVSFSPDGKILASGKGIMIGSDTIDLWDVNTGTRLDILEGHTEAIKSVSFSPDGKILASGGHDNTIRLWDVKTNAILRTLEGRGIVSSVSFSPDGKILASGNYRSTIDLWETNTGVLLQTLEGRGSVSSVSFSPDGKMLASGGWDTTVRLWDANTGDLLRTLDGHTEVVGSVSFSPDGKMLASGSRDTTVRLWDVNTGTVLDILEGHRFIVTSVSFSPDGKILASGSFDAVCLWELPSTESANATRILPADANRVLLPEAQRLPMYWIDADAGTLHHLVNDKVENILPNVQNATGLAVDTTRSTLYWTTKTSEKRGKFYRANLNGTSNIEELRDLYGVPLDIAVDPQREKLYWIDALNRIQRSDLNAQNIQNMLRDLKAPKHITLDAGRGKLYWTEKTSDQTSEIRSANLDGSNIQRVKELTSAPRGLAVDAVNGKLYLTNADGKIQRLNVDGSNLQPDLITGLDAPKEVSVDVAGRKIYWTEQGSIRRADFNGENIEDVVTGLRAPTDIVLGNVPPAAPAAPAIVELPPHATVLLANYPNPFNPETWIPYQLAKPADVTLHIYAANGALVRTLALGHQPAGIYQSRSRAAYWDGKNELGEKVASGIYFYTLSAGDFTATRKMLIRK